MRSASRPPRHRSLSDIVVSFWVSAQRDTGSDELVLPNGRAQLVVNGDDGATLLVGPRTAPSVVRRPRYSAGVSFSGAGLGALSDIPARELLDAVVDADAILGPGQWSQCLDLSTPSEVLDRLEGEVVRLVRGETEQHRMASTAEWAIRNGVRLDEVARLVGVDRRQLVPAFRASVGMAPKRYERVVRFQRALRTIRTTTPDPLATIAARCGYADQPHLSRDFKEFAGLTPGQVHGDASTAHNHVSMETMVGAG